ncbi:MAG: ATP-binding protein [Bacillota bacterium]|nr:ATP-binding protein [Bacillota bacterium]
MLKRKKKNDPTPEERDALTPRALRIQDLFAPDGMLVEFDKIRLGTGYARTYALHALPRRVQVGWLDEIFNAGDVDLSVHFVPAPDRTVTQTLISKETKARSQYILDQQSGSISRIPELEAQIADYAALREAVQLGQDRLYYLTFLITVHAATEEELRRRCEVVETVLARRGVLPRRLVLRQVDALKGVLPLAKNALHDFERNLTGGSAACCLPLSVSSGGHSSGVMLGVNLFTRAPVFLDRFAGEHVVPNQHLFTSGEPGSGKSVTVRELALLEGYRGVKTAFVDPEGEYSYFTGALGGQVVRLTPGRFSGVNPLEVEPEEEEDGRVFVNVLAKVEDALALVGSVFRFYHGGEGLGAVEAALLEEAVKEEYRTRGITEDPASLYQGGIKKPMPTLSDVQKRLAGMRGAERLAEAVKPLLAGGTVGMFDGQTTVHLADAPFICFNLRDLGGDFSRFVAVCAVLSWLWQTFAQRGGKVVPKCVAVDEAWMFLRHPDAAKYLETLARRGRKHGCALTIATQRFEEFASTPEGRAVIESCASILTLKQEEHAAEAAVEYFKLASGCADLLSRARAGQGILRTSGSTTAVQVQPAPFEWEFVETKVRGR